MATYPEHEKLAEVRDRSQAIGEFLEWLEDEHGFSICERDPEFQSFYRLVYKPKEELLAEFFEIDLKKISKEKDAMVHELRDAQTSGCSHG